MLSKNTKKGAADERSSTAPLLYATIICTGLPRRLQEAARLGFTSALVPAQGAEELRAPSGITVYTISDLAAAIRVAFESARQ